MPAKEDIESVAGQLATLTRTVEDMANQLAALRGRADSQQEQADIQRERIDLAARELAEVSERLQAAANALRQSIWPGRRAPRKRGSELHWVSAFVLVTRPAEALRLPLELFHQA
jgi:hypothetical protein